MSSSVLLLSVHSILIMAIKDMNRIAVDMMQPLRRDPFLEHEEESMPILQNTIADFKAVARTVKARMLSIGNSMEFSHAQGALNDIAEPYFQEDLTWGLDQSSLKETKDTIARYHEQGHTGLAYVLQIKLLRWGVELTRDELSKLLVCKQLFAEATEHLIRQGHLAFPPHFQGCQMFTPKELVLIPALANQILQDKRLDYLGRSSFHILVDAGVAIEWVEPSPDGLMRSIRFSSEYGRSTELPLAAVNKTDIFGRTALHLAVRHCSIFNVMRLAGLGANMHCMCLNSLSLLHIAACHGHDSMVLHLLEYGQQYTPVLDQLDGLKRTPFWYAARGAHFEVMKVLTSSANSVYVNIEHEDIHGHSSLAIAARNAHVEVLKWLLERRPENWIYAPGTPNNEHLLLAYAVQSKNSECVDLIKRFRTWTFGDDVFMRAMHYAAKKNDQSLRRELQGLYQYDFLPSRISNKRTKSTRVSQTAPKLGQV